MSVFVRIAIKGIIDATPMVSSRAIIVIINNKKAADLRSLAVNKDKIFLKVCMGF